MFCNLVDEESVMDELDDDVGVGIKREDFRRLDRKIWVEGHGRDILFMSLKINNAYVKAFVIFLYGIMKGKNCHFGKKTAQLCPGGTCKDIVRELIQYIFPFHIVIVIVFIFFAFSIPYWINSGTVKALGEDNNCVAPDRAKTIGHEQLWLEHHGCDSKTSESSKLDEVDLIDEGKQAPSSVSVGGQNAQEGQNIEGEKPYDPNDPCQNIPEGHPRDLWLIHNGCL